MSGINGACDMPYHNWYLAGDTWLCRWCNIAKQAEEEECHICGKPGIRDDGCVTGEWECACGKAFEHQEDGQIHVQGRCPHNSAVKRAEHRSDGRLWKCPDCGKGWDDIDDYREQR